METFADGSPRISLGHPPRSVLSRSLKGGSRGIPPLRNERAKMGHDRLGSANASEPLLDFFHGQEGSVVVAGRVDGAGLDSGEGFAEFGEL